MKPQNFEEKVVWYQLIFLYPTFFLGLLPITVMVCGWILGIYAAFKVWSQNEETPESERLTIPLGVWVWVICLMFLELALIMGHIDSRIENLILKDTINVFLKNWFLFVLYPLAGSCLKIRPQLLYRGVCILSVQCLVIGILAYFNIKPPAYSAPLGKLLGGSALIDLSFLDAEGTRIKLFAPWPPALGLIGACYLFLTYRETKIWLRILGVLGAIFMIWSSGSRTGQICLLSAPIITFFISKISRPTMQVFAGIGAFLTGILGPQIYLSLKSYGHSVSAQRAGSTRLRRIIFDVSVYRWKTEAFWWGHSRVVTGPFVTTQKPLGSHNHWAGVLMYFGIVGAVANIIALIWSFIELVIKSQHSREAQAALGSVMVLGIYATSENLDTLVYLLWPSLLLMGFGFKGKFFVSKASQYSGEDNLLAVSSVE